MTAAYLVSSLMWAVGGFLGGFAVGRIAKDVKEVRDTVVDDNHPPQHRSGWRRWLSGETVIGILVLVVVAGSTGLWARQSAELARVTECQRAYNEAFAQGLTARSEAARLERQAQRELLTAILSRPGDRVAGRAALDRYLEGLDQADRDRASAPLPTNTCGDRP